MSVLLGTLHWTQVPTKRVGAEPKWDKKIQDLQLHRSRDNGRVAALAMQHVANAATPSHRVAGEALNYVEQAANQYNARVLQFCSTVMPQEVCSAAAAKWQHPEISSGRKAMDIHERTLRSVSVNIRSCSDVKRLEVWDSSFDDSLAFPSGQNVVPRALGRVRSKHAPSIGVDDLTWVDLSSAVQSLRVWKAEEDEEYL